MARRREKRECRAVVLEPDAAGIDIGAEEIYVAVPPDRDGTRVLPKERCVVSTIS